jgi:hypothetical protein
MAKSIKGLQADIAKAVAQFRADVEGIRQQIYALKEDLDWLQDGPLAKEDAIAHMETYIDSLADGYDAQYGLSGAVYGRGTADLERMLAMPGRISAGAQAIGGVVIGMVDVGAKHLLAFLFGDILKTRFREALEKRDNWGPPKDKRAEMVCDTKARLHALEVEEEALIEAAEEAGVEIVRRDDCDPAVVLGLEVTEVERPVKKLLIDDIEYVKPAIPSPYLEKGRYVNRESE